MPSAADIARTAALASATVIRARTGNIAEVRSKTTAIDLVTDVDIESGVAAVQAILALDPTARFVVEEPEVYPRTGAVPGDVLNDEVWVIDPIDGTTSFRHGYPCYSVSIALMRGGTPAAGVVYNIPLDEMCWASVGAGAYSAPAGDTACARVLHATRVEEVGRAVLATGFPYDRTRPLERQIAALSALLRYPVQDIRRDGSAAADCCHVAAGRCDGFWEYDLKVWDLAAGALIAAEAGARVTDIEGLPWSASSTSILAANPLLHERVLDVICGATAGI